MKEGVFQSVIGQLLAAVLSIGRGAVLIHMVQNEIEAGLNHALLTFTSFSIV